MSLELNKRRELNRELTWDEGDDNWEAIEEAFASLEPTDDSPTTIENEYEIIAQLLADQVNQTENAIQYVQDASNHPDIESGYAYFQKLNTSNNSTNDYRVLSQEEVAAIEGGIYQKVGDQLGNQFSSVLKVIYGYGFVVKPLAGGGYILKRKEIFEKIDPASGSINIDFNNDTYYLNQTAAVSLFITNPPLEGESKTVTVDINNPSAFPLTIPPSISHEINDAPSEDYIQLVIQWLESGKVKLQYNTIA